VTAGHPVEPDKGRAYITVEPITIERNVWIGTAATVLPGVTIGADSVVAAGAVVTHDVPLATLVAGCASDGFQAPLAEPRHCPLTFTREPHPTMAVLATVPEALRHSEGGVRWRATGLYGPQTVRPRR